MTDIVFLSHKFVTSLMKTFDNCLAVLCLFLFSENGNPNFLKCYVEKRREKYLKVKYSSHFVIQTAKNVTETNSLS